MEIKVNELTCKRCGWIWVPRKADVRTCPNPKCRSVYFDREKPSDKPAVSVKPKRVLKRLKG
jgi:hypothetical protein